MVEGMVTAQHHPLMLLQVQAEEAEAVLAVHQSVLLLSMALRARTAILVGMALHVVAHMTTDPLIVAEAAVEVGSVIAAQEASPAVIASPSDPVMEVKEIGIDTAAEDETTTMGAERGIMMAMAMMTHAANGDISRFLRRYIGLLGGFCFRFQHFLPLLCLGKEDTTFIFRHFPTTPSFLSGKAFCHHLTITINSQRPLSTLTKRALPACNARLLTQRYAKRKRISALEGIVITRYGESRDTGFGSRLCCCCFIFSSLRVGYVR